MTDDPAHDYDVWCRDNPEPDPGCEGCEGRGYRLHRDERPLAAVRLGAMVAR